MLPKQKDAVDHYMVELTEALERTTEVLLSYLEVRRAIRYEERQLIEKSGRTNIQKLICLFGILKPKASGWSHLLSFLRTNGHNDLADKLHTAAHQEPKSVDNPNVTKQSPIELFCSRLAKYYLQNYVNIPTMGESPKHVKDVWVPLQIDGRSESHLAADRIDHVELLKRLKSTESRNVALVKGDPGMGKTTLAKKIAYDWASNYGSSIHSQEFSLVLALPLRSAGKSEQLDKLAIDYFMSIGDGKLVKNIDKEELLREISQLENRLLVILDGLDEYGNFCESPFRFLFAAPFQHHSANKNVAPPNVDFKLIITSRPYACERINSEFFPLRFVILPLDGSHLSTFVQLYCQTPHGVSKVTTYLNTNWHLVIHVPLILTFICFLAESVKEIPTNMTSLYDRFIRQMLRRESRQDKLAKPVDIRTWKKAPVTRSTAQLAYQGCVADKYWFTSQLLEENRVTNDSYICGFLIQKYDFFEESLAAEFPHRSIQEFFAALYCYHLILANNYDPRRRLGLERKPNSTGTASERKKADELIWKKDSQIGRFFFGICSQEGRFHEMMRWLNPTTQHPDYFIHPFATIADLNLNLVDCRSGDIRSCGQTLFELFGKQTVYTIGPFETSFAHSTHLFKLSWLLDDFRKGLHLRNRDSDGFVADWLAERKSTLDVTMAYAIHLQFFLLTQ